MANRTCTIDGCNNTYRARGWCATHWLRWRKTGDPGAAEIQGQTPRICQVDDCNRKAHARGMCTKHYQRWKKSGDPLRGSPSPSERFWSKVTEASGGCLIWTGHLHKGYGQFGVGRSVVYAHRFSYELARGAIPDGLHLDHLCRTPACVNPDHLEPVTQAENNRRARRVTVTN